MITRVRLESTAATPELVKQELAEWAEQVQRWAGGEWTEEEPTDMVLGAKSGNWGRLTIRRKT